MAGVSCTVQRPDTVARDRSHKECAMNTNSCQVWALGYDTGCDADCTTTLLRAVLGELGCHCCGAVSTRRGPRYYCRLSDTDRELRHSLPVRRSQYYRRHPPLPGSGPCVTCPSAPLRTGLAVMPWTRTCVPTDSIPAVCDLRHQCKKECGVLSSKVSLGSSLLRAAGRNWMQTEDGESATGAGGFVFRFQTPRADIMRRSTSHHFGTRVTRPA